MVKYYQVEKLSIEQIVAFHAPNKRYEVIDYKSNKMNIDYVKKKYPIISIMIPKGQCIFTEIDMEMYKFKNILNENIFYIVNPIENKFGYVVFDSSKFYVGEGTKINIWDEDVFHLESVKTDVQNVEPTLILFDTNKMNLDFKKIIYSPVNIENKNTFIKVFNHYIKNDYTKLYEKYGTIIDDLIPYIENRNLEVGNRFNRIKVIEKVLSKDVCYWIMNECEKHHWVECKHSNYSSCINIENIPCVLNYVLYASNYWVTHIKGIYDMEVDLNIKEIFIAKDGIVQKRDKKNDDAFIIFNIQLNETTIPLNYNNDTFLLNQGDMIVYNKKTMRDRGNNMVLVLMIDFFY
jgi:hypothetical protein